MRFEWDRVKAVLRLRTHGVRLEVAIRAFADPTALTAFVLVEGGELRRQTTGLVHGHARLQVAHAVRQAQEGDQSIDAIRIISARHADRMERKRNEQDTR